MSATSVASFAVTVSAMNDNEAEVSVAPPTEAVTLKAMTSADDSVTVATPSVLVFVLLAESVPPAGVLLQLMSVFASGFPLASVNVVLKVMMSVPFASA